MKFPLGKNAINFQRHNLNDILKKSAQLDYWIRFRKKIDQHFGIYTTNINTERKKCKMKAFEHGNIINYTECYFEYQPEITFITV